MNTDFFDDPRRGCAPGKANPDDFFPDGRGPAAEARAKAACHDCPFTRPCLEYAIDRGERWGVWGGVDMTLTPQAHNAIITNRQVHDLWKQRLSDGQIARQLGVNKSTVRESRHRQGLAPLYGPRGKLLEQVAA